MSLRIARFVILALCLGTPLLPAADQPASAPTHLTVEMQTVKGTGDQPMIVVWLETVEGEFVKTLQIFGKKKAYYNDLDAWQKAREPKAKNDALDAVVGATISWEKTGIFTVPLKIGEIDLLSGKYQLHIQQRKDKGGNYKSLRVPLPKDLASGEIKADNKGYLQRLTLTLGAAPGTKTGEQGKAP